MKNYVPRAFLVYFMLIAGMPVGLFADEENCSFVPLFNGKDLFGWSPVNCAEKTFTVSGDMIVCSGIPTGMLRTNEQYENFIIELDWRHMSAGGNAGLFVWSDSIPTIGLPFVRGVEIQIQDGELTENYTSHGDIFSVHGATMVPDFPHPNGWMRCLPSEHRCKPVGQWNHYRAVCNNGTIKLFVNGKQVSGASQCMPRKGYICLESEGAECHFRNIRICKLPSTNPKPEEITPQEDRFVSLFNGIDLTHWNFQPEQQDCWSVQNELLASGARCKETDHSESTLVSDATFGDFMLICDWRINESPSVSTNPDVASASPQNALVGGVRLRGSEDCEVAIAVEPHVSGSLANSREVAPETSELESYPRPTILTEKPIGEWNRFVLTLKAGQLTVKLNGQIVTEVAASPSLPASGPITLVTRSQAVEFCNIYVQEL